MQLLATIADIYAHKLVADEIDDREGNQTQVCVCVYARARFCVRAFACVRSCVRF